MGSFPTVNMCFPAFHPYTHTCRCSTSCPLGWIVHYCPRSRALLYTKIFLCRCFGFGHPTDSLTPPLRQTTHAGSGRKTLTLVLGDSFRGRGRHSRALCRALCKPVTAGWRVFATTDRQTRIIRPMERAPVCCFFFCCCSR